jgi:hypothetical protein
VQQAGLLDDTVRALAESLRETLGIAKEYPDLLVVEGTTNVIEEIGRTSLKIASLIHEYAKLSLPRKLVSLFLNPILINGGSFVGRAARFQLTDDMKSRIAQCQKSCDDLKQKLDRRLNMDTNRQLKLIKDDQLGNYNF